MECSICLKELNVKKRIIVETKCKHHYHMICLDNWLEYKDNCPMCRTKIKDYDVMNKLHKKRSCNVCWFFW